MENVRKYYSKVKQLLRQGNITNAIVNVETTRLENESLDGIRNKLLTLPKENIIHYAKFIAEAVDEELILFEYFLNKEVDYDFLYSTLGLDYLYQRDYETGYLGRIADLFERFGVAMYVADLSADIPFDETGYKPLFDEAGSDVANDEAGLDIPFDETGYKPLFDEAGSDVANDEAGLDIPFDETGYKTIWRECGRYALEIKDMTIERPKSIDTRNRKDSATVAQKWAIIRSLMECAVGWRLTDDENRLNYNKTDISKLMAFLCGGSAEFIRKHLEDELLAKDVSVILPYLENVGLNEIVKKIKE